MKHTFQGLLLFSPFLLYTFMKRIYLLIHLFFISLVFSFAQAPLSQAVIFSEQGERFQVVLNGLLQNQDFKTNVRLKDLTNEYYTCKIIFEDQTIPDIDKSYFPVPPSEEITYKIKKNGKGKYELKFVGEKPLTGAVVINPNPEPLPVNNPNPGNPNPGNNNANTNNNNNAINVNINLGGAGVNMSIPTDPAYNPNTNYNPNPGYNPNPNYNPVQSAIVYVPGYSGPVGCPAPMDMATFNQAKQSIEKQSFADTKNKMAKQILNSNCVTSSQAKELIGLFTFENDKLDIAKYCYSRVYDISNYFQVNDALGFSSSVDELTQYIQANPVKPLYNAGAVSNPYQVKPRTYGPPVVNPALNGGTVSGGKCPYPAADGDFAAMKSTISKQSFDNTKLSTAKQIVSANCLRATQIKELVAMFSFENTKVDLAKYCYAYCYDPQNYFQIYDVFSFSSSTDEVSKYINGK